MKMKFFAQFLMKNACKFINSVFSSASANYYGNAKFMSAEEKWKIQFVYEQQKKSAIC